MTASNVKRTTEIDLQCAKDLLSQATKERQTLMEELEDLKAQLEEKEDSLKKNALEMQRKSADLEDMIKIKDNMNEELEAVKSELDFSQKSKTNLELQVTEEKSTNQVLLKQLQDTANNQEKLQKAISDLRTQVNISSEDGKSYIKKIAELEAEIQQKDLKHQDLLNDYEELLRKNMEMNKKLEITAKEMTNIQNELEEIKKKEESAKNEIENIKARNYQARKETESLQKQITLKNEEVKNQFSECEGKTRSIQWEISKKDKQLKTLENKLSTMKKQVENKNKSIEELHQENKSLKKKITGQSKQCNILEAEVKELKEQLENTGMQYETTISNKQRLIDDLKSREQHLSEEVDRLKLEAEEARKLQKESDVRCQHKIAEMVALMEKHKNQYDKLVEEKDAELDRYHAMENEITSKKALLETNLSNTKQEVMSLKEELKHITEEKEKFAKEAEENKVYRRKGSKGKVNCNSETEKLVVLARLLISGKYPSLGASYRFKLQVLAALQLLDNIARRVKKIRDVGLHLELNGQA
ncbi:synaptonemal complex protein 1 [Spea bombifrons]|uniref:synaptonemal complex protein 1 n=1 Tax=Spea bombifrons TaxID=233779 RepID=UPI002349F849|nr:synaptonemal complex protein 1 [Spea bombifrons]